MTKEEFFKKHGIPTENYLEDLISVITSEVNKALAERDKPKPPFVGPFIICSNIKETEFFVSDANGLCVSDWMKREKAQWLCDKLNGE